MTRLKSSLTSFVLFWFIVIILVSMLFYHVSAVVIYNQHQQTKFINTTEVLHSLNNCAWISEVLIKEKVITLKCKTFQADEIYVSFDEKYKILARLDTNQINFNEAKVAFKEKTGEVNFEVSITFNNDKSVYWVKTFDTEWLLDMNDYSILWKVEKNYE